MQTTGARIFQNTVILTITEIMARGLGLLLMMAVARKLGPVAMGIYAFGLSFIGIFEIFVNFGFETYIQREVGRNPDSATQLWSQTFSLKVGIYSICLAVICALIPFFAVETPKREVVLILAIAMFFRTNMTATCAFFRARQIAHYEALIRMVLRLGYTSAGIYAVITGWGLITLVSLECVALAAAFFTGWWLFIRKIGMVSLRFKWKGTLNLARSTWNFFLIRIVQTVFNSIDLVMLSLISGDVSTGYYSVTVRLIGAFGFIPSAITGAFLPVLSRNRMENGSAFHDLFRIYFKWVLFIGTGIAAILAGLPGDIIRFLFGTAFIPATPTLVWMAIALLITFANWPLSNAIIAMDKEHLMLKIFAVCAVTNIGLNLLLIPALNDQGAAIATITSQFLLLFLQSMVIGKRFLIQADVFKVTIGPVTSGLICWGILNAFATTYSNFFVKLCGGGLVFLTLAFLTRSLTFNDLSRAKKWTFSK